MTYHQPSSSSSSSSSKPNVLTEPLRIDECRKKKDGGPGASVESLSDVDDEELEGYLLDAEENFFVSNGLVSTWMSRDGFVRINGLVITYL